MKKIISLILATVMLIGVMPMTAFAAGIIHTHEYETVVTAPTCTEQGYTTYTCECGDSYTDNYVDATGDHTYENGVCTGCGEKMLSFEGKTVSILSHSMSTYAGVSNSAAANSTIGNNDVYYTEGRLGVYQKDTWWQQVIDALDMELLVNNSWSGSCVFMPRKGEASVGYGDRAVNLHNDHTGEEPDIIFVYLGCNDFAYYQDTFGKAADVNYLALIQENSDGTFSYAAPETTCEAYAIMLHKVTNRYPDAEIYCMTSTARRDPDYAGDSYPDAGQPTAFSAELIKVAQHFDFPVINLENAIPKEAEIFDQYIGDKRAHSNALGMDQITNEVLSVMLGKDAEIRHVTCESDVVPEQAVLLGGSYSAEVDLTGDYTVSVVMNGTDVTAEVCSGGRIFIEDVTGDIVVEAIRGAADFRWEMVNNELVSVGDADNPLEKLGGTVTGGVISDGRYELTTSVILKHDRPWVLEWKCAEDWRGVVLSSEPAALAPGRCYLSRTKGGQLCFGIWNGSQYNNYGIDLSGLDGLTHTYRLENRIAADGSNMIWLYVDGTEIGPMNNYYVGSNSQNATSDWLSGKNFVFPYIGSDSTTLNNCALDYLQVWEDGVPPLAGKTLSVLGASISTFAGTSNGAAADTTNSTIRNNAKYYPHSVVTDVELNDAWWMQVCSDLGLRLLVNNSWSGSSLLYERGGTVGAYVDRCVQLHDDTGENVGEEPDIIGIQMGTNDFQYYKDTLGTADIDYAALITENTDGTYTYAEPVTSLEAAAIVLHKISVRYPNAEVYYLNISQRVDGTDDLIQSFNAELKQVVEHFGAHIVDIYGSAITMENFDTYIGDGRVHPNKLGMDAYTEAFKRALLANTAYTVNTHTVTLDLDGVCANYGDDKIVVDGDSFAVNLTAAAGDVLDVTVTMNGKDVTDTVYANGTVTIDAVTADVTITAGSVHKPKEYRWEFDGTDLVCVSGSNSLTKNAGTTTEGVFDHTRYALESPVVLSHDQPWSVEWKCEGTFQNSGSSSGARVFTSTDVNARYNARYIFKSNTNGIVAMGEKTTSGSHNYGIALESYGIDWTALHTYRLENRIAADSSNMVWLYVDGTEIGPMNNYYVGTANKNTTSDWLSGKDFLFPYMGTDTHGFTNCSIDYIQVFEGGHTHGYSSVITAPTCTERGYTTYTCACGDSYVDDVSMDITDRFKWNEGYVISAFNGNMMADKNWVASDYVDISAFESIEIVTGDTVNANTTLGIAFYDANKKFVSGVVHTDKTGTEYGILVHNLEVPQGVSYLRTTWYSVNHGSYNGATLHTFYCKGAGTAIPPLGHDYVLTEETKPNCSAGGTKVYICSRCGESTQETTSKGDHAYDNGICISCGSSILGNDWIAPNFAEGDYSMVVLPDTQKLVTSWEDTYYEQMQWIADNEDALNIQAVLHMGDMVDNNTAREWTICEAGTDILQNAGIPWMPMRGNHDDADYFNNYYDYTTYGTNQSWFGGAYHSDKLEHTYWFVTVGQREYMILSLGWAPSWDVLAWAQDIVEAHSDKNVILTCHAYMNSDGTLLDSSDAHCPSSYHPGYPDGDDVWDAFKGYENVVLAMGGHIHSANIVTFVDQNGTGRDVTSLLVDRQNDDMANHYGMVAVLTFHNGSNTVDVNWYSVRYDALYRAKNQFSIDVPHVHSHEYVADITVPTCTEQGYTTYTCACGDSYAENYVDATGEHTYENGVCTGCGENEPSESMSLRYDDHYDVTGKTAEIVDAGTPTSYQVGYGVEENAVLDTAVVTLNGDTLVATGIGIAKVRIDGQLYEVTVSPAPISLILLAGQSNMEGMVGRDHQSIACENGQVYSTYAEANGLTGDAGLTVENAGNYVPSALTGAYSAVNVNGTNAKLSGYPVNSLTEAGTGKYGMDSGIAYEWTQRTGEKVWLVNAAHGASGISSWQPGQSNFEEACALLGACQEVLKKEIAAGHYTFSHMGYYWCQGCADETRTAQWYVEKYTAMHDAIKSEMAFDSDLDPYTADSTMEFGGIILVMAGHENAVGYRKGTYGDSADRFFATFMELEMRGPRVAQIWMANNPELPDIHIVCTLAQDWVTMPDGSDGVAEYFASHYEDGRVDYPTQAVQAQSWYMPTTPAAVKNSIHYYQIGYNEVGRESVRNTLYILGMEEKPDVETTVTFVDWTGYQIIDALKTSAVPTADTLVVPLVYPCYESKSVAYTLSDNLVYTYYDLLDVGVDGGVLTADIGTRFVQVIGRDYYAYRFELQNGTMTSVSNSVFRENPLTQYAGQKVYTTEQPIILKHDKPWRVVFNSVDTARFMALATYPKSEEGMFYFFKSAANSGVLAMGEYKNGVYQNYGLLQSKINIDWAKSHVYCFQNVLNEDGTNTIQIYIDDEWVGTATELIINGSSHGTGDMYLSGKDFSFTGIGCSGFGLNTDQMTYLEVWEEGHTHTYESEITAPTCTEQGYTTYTCACGDSYVDDYVEATGHSYGEWQKITAPTEGAQGEEQRSCTVCGFTETREMAGVWQLYDLATHLLELPENVCCDTNLWALLPHENVHFTSGKRWGTNSTPVTSITIPLNAGDRVYATSWNKAGENGHETLNGIRLTFFDAYGIAQTLGPGESYNKFAANGGYLVAPEGTIAINIAMWYDSKDYEVFILNREHIYERVAVAPTCTEQGYNGTICLGCGNGERTDLMDALGHDLRQHDAKTVTCTENGWNAYETCCRCDHTTYVEISALGHSYGGWKQILEPSCDKEGRDQSVCSTCGETAYRDTRISGVPDKILVSNPVPENYYEGKVFLAIGDSLTNGTGVGTDERYHALVAQILNGTNINGGTSGATLCPGGHLPNKFDALMTASYLTQKEVDVVTVFLGINDWDNGVVNGTYQGKLKYDESLTYYDLGKFGTDDTTTIYGAAKMWCERILELQQTEGCENIQFAFATPVITSWNKSLTMEKDWNQDKVNVFGHTLREYCIAIMEVCAYYEIPVLDLNMYSGMYYHSEADNNVAHFGGDGIHPGVNGHQMMADAFVEFLLEGYRYENRTVTDCGHSYESAVSAPTCTEDGYTTYRCSACHYSYADDYVDATGHSYKNGVCTTCGAEHPNMANYEGKVISVLGDSISTFAGYIPTADGFNLEHLARYPQDNLLTDVNETWWMQVINGLDAKLGINDSWRGATVSGAVPVTTGTTGENAAMGNLTRIQNLGANGTPDVILFYGGTNDLAHVSKVGSFDPDAAPAAVDLTTKKWDNLADGYVHTLLRLRHYYPDAAIIAMLPTYTTSYYSTDKLAQANAVLAQICDHYGVTYVDLRDCGISTNDLPDGIHPDANGMDCISEAVMEALLDKCEMEPGENVVHSVTHKLTGAESTLSYYKGVTHGKSFVTDIIGENVTVSVTMGGVDITDTVYANGVVTVAEVTGDIVLTAEGYVKPIYADHLQQLPEGACSGTNLWAALEHDAQYYTVNGWGTHSSGTVYSVTFPVSAGDRLYATSFGEAGKNGGSINGIRVTWFDKDSLLKTVSADEIYTEFSANGYLAVPEGAAIVSIPVWKNSDANEIYILNRDHGYENGICSVCGAEHPNLASFEGKVISILGGSTCTFDGFIPVSDGFNLAHRPRYPQSNLLTDVNDTWWMQVVNELDAKLGINDSWAGSQVLNTLDTNSGDLGPDAAMASLTRIQNLGANGTPDLILFYGAMNDIGRAVTLGEFDAETAPAQVDLAATKWDNLAEAYVAAIMRMQHYYPDAQIIAMLPGPTASYYTETERQAYCAVLKAICDHYGVPTVDLSICGLTIDDMPDGTHPNAEGMDYITTAVLETLLSECQMEPGENVVHSVTHQLTGAKSSMSHYKGVSNGKSFAAAITGEDITVAVTMGGADITEQVYADGKITISAVTGDVVITAKGVYNADGRLQLLPEDYCCGTNLWTLLEPVNEYYTASGWGNNSNSNYSVTFPVAAGDRIWATSFGEAGTNGYSANAVRITWFSEEGVLQSLTREEVYAEFAANGWVTAPEGAAAVNIPMASNANTWEIYILNREHNYEGVVTAPTCTGQGFTAHTCATCGDSYVDDYVAALGHSYGDWSEVTAPTCDAEGRDKRTCAVCGEEQYRDTRISGDPNKILVSEPVKEGFYSGKKFAFIGDSITYGVGLENRDEEAYPYLIAELLNITAANLGVSGSGYCTGGRMATNNKLTVANICDADVITILLGVNDWAWAVKEGFWNGTPGYYGESETYYQLGAFCSDDTSTFYGALKWWCETIVELKKLDGFEEKQFVVITPMITSWNNSMGGKRDWDQDKTNVHGHTLRQYCTAILEVCAEYDIPVFDANMFSGIYYKSAEDNNVTETSGDGVHISAKGHALLADALTEFLLEGYTYENRTVTDCGHSYESAVTAPTCTEDGYTTYRCSACHYSYESDRTEATGHSYDSVVTAPTCTGQGFTTHTCTVCGDSYVDDYVDATGHNLLCTVEGGKQYQVCTLCDYRELVCSVTLNGETGTVALEDCPDVAQVFAAFYTQDGRMTYVQSVELSAGQGEFTLNGLLPAHSVKVFFFDERYIPRLTAIELSLP